MSEVEKKKKSKKPVRASGEYVVGLNWDPPRRVAPTLAQAKEAFDAAQLYCVKACLGYARPDIPILAVSPRAIACQNAGLALVDAYAAILRARDAAPVKLTEKGEAAQIGPRGKSFPGSKRRGSR